MILSPKIPDGKNALTAVVTICCREKDAAKKPLPAGRRYRSERIKAVWRVAREAGLPFFILSGKFGLLRPEDPIPYYDYLLPAEKAPEIALKIKRFLRNERIGRIILFIPDPALDPKVIPYREAFRMGTEGAAELEIRRVPPLPESL